MVTCKGYAAYSAQGKLAPFDFQRRDLNTNDVLIDIQYCGVCHSDIHQVRNEWKKSLYPMVPGHEIVGVVQEVGSGVSQHKVGDTVGVGCMVDSCRECLSCREDLEQYCEKGCVGTYNSQEYNTGACTYGGYSTHIVVREEFVLKIPRHLDLAAAAPLLCAGITTYSPLNHWKVKKGDRVGVVGLGGLGHMAVKIAHAMKAHVVVFTTSEGKVDDAKRLGADEVILSKDFEQMQGVINSLEFIINTVAAPHNLTHFANCLKRDGTMVMVGLPDKPHPSFEVSELIFKRKCIAGSLIGGIKETQEMLDFCGKHDIVCDVEVIPIDQIHQAYERTIQGDVKYRFVIDLSTLK